MGVPLEALGNDRLVLGILGSSASRTASSEIAVIDDQREAKAEFLTAMGYHLPLPAGGEQRSALGVPGDSSVFSSFEGLAWRAVACAAEVRRASSDSASHHLPRGGRGLAIGATWSVLEHLPHEVDVY